MREDERNSPLKGACILNERSGLKGLDHDGSLRGSYHARLLALRMNK